MFLPPRSDVASHVVAQQRREIVFGAIPRIPRQLPCLSARVRFDMRQHRRELVRVAAWFVSPCATIT